MEAWGPEIKPGTWGSSTCDKEALQLVGRKWIIQQKVLGQLVSHGGKIKLDTYLTAYT